MQVRNAVLGVALGCLLAGASIQAHHSFASEFDVDKPVTLRGMLTKMDWVNPHGWLYMDVKDKDGKVTTWAIESGAPNALLRRGLRASDFPPGVEVVVEGFRAKDGSTTANGTTVKFADGRNFFLGADAAANK